MLKKDKFIIAISIFVVLLIDQFTKQWVFRLEDIVDFGFFQLFPTPNKVSFLGIFSKLPQSIKLVGLTTFGSIFIIFFGFIQLILPGRLIGLRLGFSFLLAGVLGNVIDRLLFDYVIDFIIFGSKENIYFVFNVADISEITGLILIFHNVIKNFETLWPKNNKRKQTWVNPAFQIRFILLNLTLISSFSVVSFVFTYTFFKVSLNEYLGQNNEIKEHIFQLFLRLYLLINIVLFLCYFAITLIASHRIAGPIYAFKKYIGELLKHSNLGEYNKHLVLRENDEFEDLVLLSKEIKDSLSVVKK